MSNYKLINNIFGWFAFVFALVVYSLTSEPTASLWDCGEFISAAYRLQVVHPPGAPLFLMIGRLFALFAGSDVTAVAKAVNMSSAVMSALCVLFTFWITTYFGRKTLEKTGKEINTVSTLGIMVAGLVAALSLTFTDTFWFSAVEAEVYASSSFFMSFTFWCILKWEGVANEKYADRWLVFIGYVVGLAIGVHLLNLLVIPAIVLVYYFKKFDYSFKGLIMAMGIGFVLLFFVQLFVIPGLPSLAAAFDRTFVNSFGMGFGSGVIVFLVLLIGLLIFGLWWSTKNRKTLLNTALLGFMFILIGYSSYAMVVIRSLANTPIDMNNPEDPVNLVYYLNREQYGDRPLLKGPHYRSQAIGYEEGKDNFIKGEKKYEFTNTSFSYKYDPRQMMIFPRISDASDPSHISGYKDWGNIKGDKDPKMGDNLTFFWRYQMGHMYFRYFFWNFAGRQNDNQGLYSWDKLNGNWISGIPVVDAARLGNQSDLPEAIKKNPSRNTYYLLPFLLGIVGLVYQFRSDKNNTLVNGLLFVVTGVMLIIYLNPPPFEPRERDYVFVGSFQVFCTWIGLGVLGLISLLSRYLNAASATAIASVVGLFGSPYLLGSQNWDDHDRSGRFIVVDFAKDYLNSCAPNAILFTNGDNDTYPLWYAQNVEGIRTDVRVVNLSLLNASDYVESLRYKMFDSEPIKLTFTKDQIRTGRRDYVEFIAKPSVADPSKSYNLKDVMKFVATDGDPNMLAKGRGGQETNFLPSKKFFIPVNRANVLQTNTVPLKDTSLIVNEMRFELPVNGVTRNSLILLDVIANNIWDRPIYFTTTTGTETYLGMMDYFQQDGLTYRLVPIYSPATKEQADQREYGRIDTDKQMSLLMNTFTWGGMENKKMWIDEKARLVPVVTRNIYVRLARELIRQDRKADAIKVLEHGEKVLTHENLPYDARMIYFAATYYEAGAKEQARKVLEIIADDNAATRKYLSTFTGKSKGYVANDYQQAESILGYTASLANQFGDTAFAQKLLQKGN